MSKIKSKNTKPETIMYGSLITLGISFEKHSKLLGNPDVKVFDQNRILVFIDGDFWHRWDFHKRKATLPEYWVKK